MTTAPSQIQIVPHDSIIEYRFLVYAEHQALWKETDPRKRAIMARQLAGWTTTLAEMEEAEATTAEGVSAVPPLSKAG